MRAPAPLILTLTLALTVGGGCGEDDTGGPAADTATVDAAVGDDTTAVEDTAAADTATADTATADTAAADTATTDTTPGPAACEAVDDCTYCAFDRPVASTGDCYCVLCPTTPLSEATCTAYAAQHAEHCAPGWDEASPCPVPRCVAMPPLACDAATSSCVNSCDLVSCEPVDCAPADRIIDPGQCCPRCSLAPDACASGDDCTRCAFSKPVETVADCYCPLCPSHVATETQCGVWASQWQATCAGTWESENPCPVAICLEPAPVGCEAGACVGCDQVTCEPLDCPASRQRVVAGDCCPSCAPPPAPCGDGASCQWCPYSRGVGSVSECYCTLCASYGVTTAECAQWGAEWDTHCAGAWQDDNPCPVAICLEPPPVVCDAGGACVAGDAPPAR